MPCNCESYECLEAKYNPCSEGVQLDITSTETGTWSASIEFNGAWTDFSFGVESGDKIVIPTQFLNERYIHKIKFYDGSGDLLNDTCYQLSARATMSAGEFTPIPPDVVAQIFEELASLQEQIDEIDETLVDHEFDVLITVTGISFSDARLLNRTLSTLSYQGQDYNSEFWTKPLGSDVVTTKNDPDSNPFITFLSGTTVTCTLDL